MNPCDEFLSFRLTTPATSIITSHPCTRAQLNLALNVSLWLGLGLLGASALAQDEAPLSIPRARLKEGQQVRERRSLNLQVQGEVRESGKRLNLIDQRRSLEVDKLVSLKKGGEEAPQIAEIHYKTYRLSTRAEGRDDKDESLQGLSVTVHMGGGAHVKDRAGERVSKELQNAVLLEESLLLSGHRFSVLDALSAKPWKLGEMRRFEPNDARTLVEGTEDEFRFEALTLTFRGQRDLGAVSCAIFEARLEGQGGLAPIKTSLTLGGELVVEVKTGPRPTH
jgi:hypothetical protein